jgi:phosphate transport system substrate-binding protein
MPEAAPRLALLAVGALLGVACTRVTPDPGSSGRDKTSLTVKGSDTMVILGQRWAEDYMAVNPAVTVQVSGGGSGTGIAALVNGGADICESSRPMKDKERADLLAKRGVPAIETAVALDALAVYVNERNPLRVISLPALGRIYAGTTTTWKDLGGPDHAIVLYGREDNSGTYAYFKEHVLHDGDFAAATQALGGTSAVANAVKGDLFGIGYGGVAYLAGIRALAIQKGEGSVPVAPSLRAAQDGTYPVTRPLYFYTAGEPTGVIARFIAWVVGPEGQRTIADVGYYPLPEKG